jgi:hypothetical protein
MIEISPLTVGQMNSIDVEYHYQSDWVDRPRRRTVGGVIETFAYGRYGENPFLGLADGETSDYLRVPEPSSYLDIQFAGAASSYAPGAFVESFPHFNIAENLGLHMSYWSPADRLPEMKDTLFADGGSYMNIMLPSMLQRRVKKIILFLNEGQSIMPPSSWNPATDTPSASQISDTLSSMFGVIPEDAMDYTWQKRSFDITKNQYFDTSDWVPVATGLQNAQQEGNGIIYTANLTTVENSWWGIPAGITSEITFVYLGRLKSWEAELSDSVYPLFVPSDSEEAQNLGIDVSEGPFKGFPHYMTSGGLVNNERANALADLTGWTITKNEKLFRRILS